MAKRDYLTTAELAARWGYEQQTLRLWRKEGKGPPWFRPSGHPSGHVAYRLSDIKAWEKTHKITPISGTDAE